MSKMFSRSIGFGLLFPLLLPLLGALPAEAQMSVVVSPIRAEHQIPGGAAETDVVQVRNEGSKPARVKVYVEDWQMDGKGEITFARPGKSSQSCAPWLQVNPTDFRLEAGLSRDVRYTLTVPSGVRTGSYWGAIIVETMPVVEGAPVQKRMAVHGRIGVMVYETAGSPEIKALFQDLQVTPGKKGLNFKLSLANQGLGFFRVKKSRIILKNSQGQEVSRTDIPDIPVLPGHTRELELKQELTLPPGTYLAEAVLDVGRRELLGRKKTFTIGH